MRQKELTLEGLIAGCKKKDFRSEELLYKTYFGYLSGVAYRYTKERNESVELVNDAFLRIFKKLDSFNFSGPADELPKAFKGWIGRITANIAIDRLRVKRTTLYLEDMTDDALPDIAFETPDSLTFKDITLLISRLPQVQALIFNMHEIEGFSHEEISTKLNIPSSTSRVYLTRAKTRLAALYQNMMRTYDEK